MEDFQDVDIDYFITNRDDDYNPKKYIEENNLREEDNDSFIEKGLKIKFLTVEQAKVQLMIEIIFLINIKFIMNFQQKLIKLKFLIKLYHKINYWKVIT